MADEFVALNIPFDVFHALRPVIVWRAAASLLLDEGPCQNLPVAHAYLQLAGLYLSLLGIDGE